MIAVVLALFMITATVHQQFADTALIETRYCGEPKRDAAGDIIRRTSVRAAFQRIHPCPSNGQRVGPCPGWHVDHVIPLACGGCDTVANMQWLPLEIKTGAGPLPKDRWERSIYGGHVPGTICTVPPR